MVRGPLSLACVLALIWTGAPFASAQEKKAAHFARFVGQSGEPVYGVVEGDKLREITAAPFAAWKATDRVVPVAKAKFLAGTDARNVYALAGNYQDHTAGLPPERLEKFKVPQFFLKPPACLCGHGDDILVVVVNPTAHESLAEVAVDATVWGGRAVERTPSVVGIDGADLPITSHGRECFRGSLEPDGLRVIELLAPDSGASGNRRSQ